MERYLSRIAQGKDRTMNIVLNIEGMDCGGCVRSVEKALKADPSVQSVIVDLAGAKAHVEAADGTQVSALIRAVEDAGFGAAPAA